MNNLSLLILLSDIAPSIAWAITFSSAAGVIFSSFFLLMSTFETRWFINSEENARINKRFRKVCPPVLYICLFGFFISMLVPSDKDTYYLIAASEAGEEVLASDEAKKARQVVSKYLDELLEEETVVDSE